MSDEKKAGKVESGAGAGQPDNYSDRYAAYKRELQEALVSVPAGANMGYLIAELRKKHGLGTGDDKQVADFAPPQGNWSLAYLQERHTKRMAQEAEARGVEQKEADEKKHLKDLRARLIRAQFQKPESFTWPAESRDVLRPFELAKDYEIWACFSLLKILLREVLTSEFNLTGAEVDLIRFMDDAKIYPGGEKQLLSDALLALRSLLRIMFSKSESKKPEPKADKPVVKAQGAPVAPTERRRRAQSAEFKQVGSSVVSSGKTELKPEVPVKSVLALKQEFSGFQWTNKFRKTLRVIKPMVFNEELEKAFALLIPQYQRAIVFRFRVAKPAVSLKGLMAGGLKRGVEEIVKKAMEDLRQKVLVVRREEGVSVKPSVPAEPELKLSQPETPAPAIRQNQRRKDTLSSQLVFSPQSVAAWIKKVKEADSAEIPNFFREISLKKLNKALLKRGVSAESTGQILPLAEIVKKGSAFTLKQAKVFLLCFGEAKIPFKIIGETFGISPKTSRIISEKAINKIAVFLKDYSSVAHGESSKSQLLRHKTLSNKMLELAQDAWTDKMLVSLQVHLGELANLLVHPEQLALALNFHNRGIAKDVFLLFFGKLNAKTVTEIAEYLGRTPKEVIDAKTKLLRRISRRLQRILAESQPKEVFSAHLTSGFDPAEYASLRGKEISARSQLNDEKPISQKCAQWLASFGDKRLKRLALAIVVQLKERGLEDWFLAELGLIPAKEVDVVPAPILLSLSETIGPFSPPETVALRVPDKPVIKRGDCSKAARLLKNPAFRNELGIFILPEALRRILPELDKITYFQKNGLRPSKILEMRYLGDGNGGKPLSKLKIGEKFGGYTRPTVSDWLRRIMEKIRDLASDG